MNLVEYRAELLRRMTEHGDEAKRLRESAHEHQYIADSARHELELLDTPELPNLFTSCPTNPPIESQPNAS